MAGGWETQYTCCSAAIGSTGCQVAKQHVQDGRKENLEGFVKTFEKELSGDAHPGVYALDCEMSYTTYGLELTCITVVDTDLQVVYDTFVRPDNEIVDYNTRCASSSSAHSPPRPNPLPAAQSPPGSRLGPPSSIMPPSSHTGFQE